MEYGTSIIEIGPPAWIGQPAEGDLAGYMETLCDDSLTFGRSNHRKSRYRLGLLLLKLEIEELDDSYEGSAAA